MPLQSPSDGNLFPLRVAWVGLFTPCKCDVFCSKRPSLHSEWKRRSLALKMTTQLWAGYLWRERVMSAAEVGACCSKLFWRRELRYLFTMQSTLTARRPGITEPSCRSSPLGSSESKSPWRSPALACILKTCHIQTPLGMSVLPTASRPWVPALCSAVCSVKWKHMEKMPARPLAWFFLYILFDGVVKRLRACPGWWRGGGGEEGMLDLDLVAVFSVITAGFWCRLSEKKKKKKKKKKP